MKRTSVIMLFFLVPGCTGLDKHAADTFYPLNNPNTPDVQSETARRIRGDVASTDPILPEEGDVWPGQPDPVPSLQDVSRSNSQFLDKWNRSRPKLDADLKQQLSDGQGMSEGEDTDKRYGSGKGVMPIGTTLPSHVHDNAQSYLQPVSRGVVTIPNGDGTVTLIAPDGSVEVVQKSKAAFFRKLKTFHKKTMPDDAVAPVRETPVRHKKAVPDDAVAPVRETPVRHKKAVPDGATAPARKASGQKKVREKQHLHPENHRSSHKSGGKKHHHKHYVSDDIEW